MRQRGSLSLHSSPSSREFVPNSEGDAQPTAVEPGSVAGSEAKEDVELVEVEAIANWRPWQGDWLHHDWVFLNVDVCFWAGE